MRLGSTMALFAALALCACGGAAPPTAPDPVVVVSSATPPEHPYFPLETGRIWTYQGEKEGAAVFDVVNTMPERRLILDVACVGLRQVSYADGQMTEVSIEWYASDENGDIWQYGEETFVMGESGALEPAADGWIAGENGAVPSRFLPADLQVGDTFVVEFPGGHNVYTVIAVDAVVETPAGTFHGCLVLSDEQVDDEDETEESENDKDIILFAPGTGRVSESTGPASAPLQLTSTQR